MNKLTNEDVRKSVQRARENVMQNLTIDVHGFPDSLSTAIITAQEEMAKVNDIIMRCAETNCAPTKETLTLLLDKVAKLELLCNLGKVICDFKDWVPADLLKNEE